jgi:hypothetical protein
MTDNERRTQIQLVVKKITTLRGLLTKTVEECKRDAEVSLCDGDYHDATMAVGRSQGLIQADEQVMAFHKWFLNQFEADL